MERDNDAMDPFVIFLEGGVGVRVLLRVFSRGWSVWGVDGVGGHRAAPGVDSVGGS